MAISDAPVAIVTGAGTGVGAAVAGRLAGLGWRLLIGYRNSRDGAEASLAACEARGPGAMLCRGDVREDGDCRRLAAVALDAWGRIDGLVNNAGITRFVAAEDLDGLSAEDFQDLYATNVVGAWQMTRAAVPALRKAGAGAVVNVSSNAGLVGAGSSIAYCASKAALNTLTLSLARTLAPEIRVNAVCPGYIDTDWSRRTMDPAAYEAFKASLAALAPLGRVCTADDVAEAVVWLLAGGSTVTGELLRLDSGVHLATARPPQQTP